MSHHIVKAEELSYSYPDGTAALRGVSFRLEHGESAALAGGNGAGKSTLLRLFTGCLLPGAGRLNIGGADVGADTLPEIRRSVGMLFQNPDDQLFMPTVFEDVSFGLRNLGAAEAEVKEKALRALDRVGAAHLAGRPPYRLSQGEKRAAAIAGVLAMEPDILVMDEPTAGLDPAARRRLIGLLKTFHHTKIIATHDLDFALEVCGRALLLEGGSLAADGPAEALFRDAALMARCRLEVPPSLAARRGA